MKYIVKIVLVFCFCFYLVENHSLLYSADPAEIKQLQQKARSLYEQDQLEEACKIYLSILKKYPNHESTMIQYAKTLYRMDKTSEAYTIFSKVNLNNLDVPTSYEYGLSHFWQKQYPQAYAAFKRVPVGHALYDLSCYYGAISAMKMKRYTEAEFMMSKAVVLPDNLQESKKIYQKHIAELKNFEEQKNLKEEELEEKRRIINELNEKKLQQEELNTKKKLENIENKRIQNQQLQQQVQKNNQVNKSVPKKIKIKPKYVPSEIFHKIDKEAKVSYNYRNDGYTFFENGGTTSTVGSAQFNFKNGPTFFLGKRNPTVVGVQLNLGVAYNKVTGEEYRNYAYESELDILRVYSNFFDRKDKAEREASADSVGIRFKASDVETQEDPSVSESSGVSTVIDPSDYRSDGITGIIGANPWVDFPLKNRFWISLGSDIYLNLDGFSFDKSMNTFSGYIIVGKEFDESRDRLYLQYKFLPITRGSGTEIFINKIDFVYQATYKKSVYLRVDVREHIYSYAVDDVPGPGNIISLYADSNFRFPVGIYLGGQFCIQYVVGNYFVPDFDVSKAFDTNGLGYHGKAYFRIIPASLEWLFFEVSQSISGYSWDAIKNEETNALMEQNVASYSDTFSFNLGANLLF